MSTQSPAIEAGKVFIPEKAPWLDALHTEVASFPNGSHDDQIDSISQVLSWVARRNYGFPKCYSGVTGRRIW
jgi:predicted phage terminase large subunit-like protein